MAGRLAGSSILVVEDERLLARRYRAFLEKEGAEVAAAGDVAEARRLLADLDFDAALVDVNLPDGRGTELLAEGAFGEATVVIVMTAGGGVEGAVEAVRLGAADYLVKPFDPEELPVRLARARRSRNQRRAERFAEEQQGGPPGVDFFFGRSLEPMREQLGKILAADRRLGKRLPPVLIEGETGTGKTTIARWIHREGPRRDGPLIEVNCSALPEALAESELFGHEKGAFTDAKAARVGLMEAAEGGTLFLDELPSLPAGLQAKILTALEDHAVRRVGSSKMTPVDVRIVAATNADLPSLVREGRFREDLYHRLDLFRVRLPPLRERGEDIVPLAEALAARLARQYRLRVPAIGETGRRRLLAHRWPGNVRELAHEIERDLVFGEGRLTFDGLAAAAGGGGAGAAAGGAEGPAGFLRPGFVFPEEGFVLEAAVDELVRRALAQAGGNVSAAARLLGVSRDVVRYRLGKTGAEPPAP